MAESQSSPLQEANVVVVHNASDHDHFAVSGEGPYRAACPEWARLTFLPDHDIAGGLVDLLEDGAADAVVFASNALATAAARRAVAEPRFTRLWRDDGPSADVGVVVLHQYTRPGERYVLDFLGTSSFSLAGIKPRSVKKDEVRFRSDWLFTDSPAEAVAAERWSGGLARGYGYKKHCVWTRLEPAYPGEWECLAWEDGADPAALDSARTLIAACRAGDRVVVASRVPIDLTREVELLGSLLAACARPRGCLVVEAPSTTSASAFSPSLAEAIQRRRFVYRVHPPAAEEIDPRRAPYHFFDELIVAPEWRVDELDALTEDAVLGKLEQGGSIVVSFSGPEGRRVAVRLSGQPQYAARANHVAGWLVSRLDEFKGDPWSMRALAELVVATRTAYEDERLIPEALREQYVRKHLAGELKARVSRGNVDQVLLATVAAYAALRALGVTGIEDMRKWIERRLDDADDQDVLPSVLAQALVMVPELATDARRKRVRAAPAQQPGGRSDDPNLRRAYEAVLFAREEPARLSEAARDEALGLSVQAELLRAVTRHAMEATNEVIALAARVRERIDDLARAEGALEAVCLGNAALIELARRQGIGPNAAVRGRPREVDARTVETTELVKERDDAHADARAARRAGRVATTVLAVVMAACTAALEVVIAVVLDLEVGTRWSIGVGAFGLISGAARFLFKKARDAGVPPWPFQVTEKRT